MGGQVIEWNSCFNGFRHSGEWAHEGRDCTCARAEWVCDMVTVSIFYEVPSIRSIWMCQVSCI